MTHTVAFENLHEIRSAELRAAAADYRLAKTVRRARRGAPRWNGLRLLSAQVRQA